MEIYKSVEISLEQKVAGLALDHRKLNMVRVVVRVIMYRFLIWDREWV